MDAYDLSKQLCFMWAQHYDKHSGEINKTKLPVDVVVKLEGKEFEISSILWNTDVNKIEMVLKND